MGAILSKRAPLAWPCDNIIRLRGGGLPGCSGPIYRRNERLESGQRAERLSPANVRGWRSCVRLISAPCIVAKQVKVLHICSDYGYRAHTVREAKGRSPEQAGLNGLLCKTASSSSVDSRKKLERFANSDVSTRPAESAFFLAMLVGVLLAICQLAWCTLLSAQRHNSITLLLLCLELDFHTHLLLRPSVSCPDNRQFDLLPYLLLLQCIEQVPSIQHLLAI